MSSTLPTLGLPWSLPFYRALNGPHPLVQSFLENNEAIRPYEITRTFNPQNSIGVAVGTALAQHCGSIDDKADQTKYIERLHLLDQICIEGQGDSYDAFSSTQLLSMQAPSRGFFTSRASPAFSFRSLIRERRVTCI